MAHKSLVFGYIEGSWFTPESCRAFHRHNTWVIRGLPKEDVYPFLTEGMFCVPDLQDRTVVFRTPVIHFGFSVKNFEFGDIPEWLDKFEGLLARLFWFEAEVHINTDIRGTFSFAYRVDDSILDMYHVGNPQPTTKWERVQFGKNDAAP